MEQTTRELERAALLGRLSLPPRVLRFWLRWRAPAVWVGVAYLIVAALGRLIYALPYLVADKADWSALDLTYRYEEVSRWFDGLPVYGALDRLLYPPASYIVLWPFLGWLPFSGARVLWAASTLAAAALMAWVAYRAGDTFPRRERLFVALLAFAAFPVQISILVGQLPVHAIAFAAAAAFLLARARPAWWTDLLGAVLLAASLVKPTLTAPLAAATLIATNRWRPTFLSAGAYLVLALMGVAVQPGGFIELHVAWLASTSTPSLIAEGVPNLHLWLAWLGRESWAPPASVLVLLAFCVWAWRHRRADPWLLIGAAAIVARLWAYHREYDDVVLILVTVGLLRTARMGAADTRPLAAILLAAAWAALLTPTWAFYELPASIVLSIQWAHTLIWLAVLAFFVRYANAHASASRLDADSASRPAAVGAG